MLIGRQQVESLGPYNVALTRLGSDGRIDRSFGERGKVLVDPTERRYDPSHDWVSAPGDGLVVLGSYGGNGGHYLFRLRQDGAVDRAFGDGGLVVDDFADDSALSQGLAVQPNGRILVLARTDRGALIRAYRPDGSPARGFGRHGNLRIAGNFPGPALLSRPDGRILIAGQPDDTIGRDGGTGSEKLIIDALLPDGSRDTAFGRDGRARMRMDIPSGDLIVGAATVLPGGAIAVAGEIGFFSSDAMVARFTADGRADREFGGGDGWRRFDLGPVDSVFTVAGLPSGRLVVVGGVFQDRFGDDTRTDPFLAALRRDGRFWRSFGDCGVVRDDFGGRSASATDAAVVDGKLVVVGGRNGNMFAARYFLR